MGEADERAERTYALAARAGITELSRLLVNADGAEWIRRRVEQYFPHASQILDWYHAMAHLGTAVRECVAAEMMKELRATVLNEQRLKEECERQIEPLKTQMWEGTVQELIAAVSALPQRT